MISHDENATADKRTMLRYLELQHRSGAEWYNDQVIHWTLTMSNNNFPEMILKKQGNHHDPQNMYSSQFHNKITYLKCTISLIPMQICSSPHHELCPLTDGIKILGHTAAVECHGYGGCILRACGVHKGWRSVQTEIIQFLTFLIFFFYLVPDDYFEFSKSKPSYRINKPTNPSKHLWGMDSSPQSSRLI